MTFWQTRYVTRTRGDGDGWPRGKAWYLGGKFGGSVAGAPFPSVLVIFRPQEA
jgi:hypothetical protein